MSDFAQSFVVLVVEDEPDVRELAREFLMSVGLAVQAAKNGEEAWAALERGDLVDLLFTDVAMPGSFDGVELARRALTLRPKLPVIIASGYAGYARERQLSTLPPHVLFLRKPYRLSVLETAIRRLLVPESS